MYVFIAPVQVRTAIHVAAHEPSSSDWVGKCSFASALAGDSWDGARLMVPIILGYALRTQLPLHFLMTLDSAKPRPAEG